MSGRSRPRVAGLPDGGAAFATVGGRGGRASTSATRAGAPWQATPAPLPA